MLNWKCAWGLLVILGMTLGCSKKDDDDDDSSPTVLNGTWNTGCIDEDDDASSKQTAVYGDTSFTGTSNQFSDSACATATFSIVFTGTYKITGAATTPTGAQNLQYTMTKVVLTPASDDFVDGFNGSSFCGITTWVKGKATDISDKTCEGEVYTKTTYDIFKIDGNTYSDGQNDDDLDGSTAAKRPTELNATKVYTKS